MIRTASGLVACTAVIYTASGPVSGGGNMTSSVSSQDASGSIYRKAPSTVTTDTVTASATGGATPYTFAWMVDDPDWRISSQSAATTAFQSPTLSAGDSATTTARCLVTDKNGQSATTPDVTVYASNNYEVS